MQKTFIKDLGSFVGTVVFVSGWVHNKRSSGSIAFLEIRDGSGFVQAVVSKQQVSPETWVLAEQLTQESSVVLSGTVTKHPKQEHVYELQVSGIAVVQIAKEYPIAKKEHGPEFL